MPTDVQKKTYNNIMNYYNLAEELIDTFEQSGDRNLLPYINDAENFVAEIEKNTEIIVDNFLKYVGSGNYLSGVEKHKIEKAKKNIENALESFINCFNN